MRVIFSSFATLRVLGLPGGGKYRNEMAPSTEIINHFDVSLSCLLLQTDESKSYHEKGDVTISSNLMSLTAT